MGRTYLLKTVADEIRLLMKNVPCLLRYDWSRPIIAESGRGKDWVDPKINDPKQGNQDPIENKKGGEQILNKI
ncbi:hypothetical protein TNCV_1312871 [Trichonephila clavipes]|nr:hypothetical protein TNCV_1312871 [Trichonephila clavipes]